MGGGGLMGEGWGALVTCGMLLKVEIVFNSLQLTKSTPKATQLYITKSAHDSNQCA